MKEKWDEIVKKREGKGKRQFKKQKKKKRKMRK